jgi:hypothetical protein
MDYGSNQSECCLWPARWAECFGACAVSASLLQPLFVSWLCSEKPIVCGADRLCVEPIACGIVDRDGWCF